MGKDWEAGDYYTAAASLTMLLISAIAALTTWLNGMIGSLVFVTSGTVMVIVFMLLAAGIQADFAEDTDEDVIVDDVEEWII